MKILIFSSKYFDDVSIIHVSINFIIMIQIFCINLSKYQVYNFVFVLLISNAAEFRNSGVILWISDKIES